MKSLLCAFILLLGLARAYDLSSKHDLIDLLDTSFCTSKIDDKEVCRYADSMLLAYDALRRLDTYKDKIDKAKALGDRDETSRLGALKLKVGEDFFRSVLKACDAWDAMTYKGRRFIVDSVVHVSDGTTSEVIRSEDEMEGLCVDVAAELKKLEKIKKR